MIFSSFWEQDRSRNASSDSRLNSLLVTRSDRNDFYVLLSRQPVRRKHAEERDVGEIASPAGTHQLAFQASGGFNFGARDKGEGKGVERRSDFGETGTLDQSGVHAGIRAERNVDRLSDQCRNELLAASQIDDFRVESVLFKNPRFEPDPADDEA